MNARRRRGWVVLLEMGECSGFSLISSRVPWAGFPVVWINGDQRQGWALEKRGHMNTELPCLFGAPRWSEMPLGKVRVFSQSLPEALTALQWTYGGRAGQGFRGCSRGWWACGLHARALPTANRLSLMRNEKPFSPHPPILTSKLWEATSHVPETIPVSPAVLA